MMDNTAYIKIIFLFCSLSLAAIALSNFIIDPENLYSKYSSKEQKITSKVFVNELMNSKLSGNGTCVFLTTENPEVFNKSAESFMSMKVDAQQIKL